MARWKMEEWADDGIRWPQLLTRVPGSLEKNGGMGWFQIALALTLLAHRRSCGWMNFFFVILLDGRNMVIKELVSNKEGLKNKNKVY